MAIKPPTPPADTSDPAALQIYQDGLDAYAKKLLEEAQRLDKKETELTELTDKIQAREELLEGAEKDRETRLKEFNESIKGLKTRETVVSDREDEQNRREC